MKQPDTKQRWYFIDEAGDPAFYTKGRKIIVGTEGCSRTFSVGFLWTLDPEPIRNGLEQLRSEMAADLYLKDVPSIKKSLVAFHAKDDCAEVRQAVFKLLSQLEFRVNVIVARKNEPDFRKHFDCSQDKYYDFLVSRLLWNQLHVFAENTIVFSRRGTKARQHSLREAVALAVREFRTKHADASKTDVIVLTDYPTREPALQAADYAMWAVQRAFEKGEMRYFEFLRDKYHFVWDIFDVEKRQRHDRIIYTKKDNPFDVEKISPLS